MSQFICERLAKRHERTTFKSGVPELDEYLRKRSRQDIRRRATAVFVMVPEDGPMRIVGYYMLSSASVVLDELPDELLTQRPTHDCSRVNCLVQR